MNRFAKLECLKRAAPVADRQEELVVDDIDSEIRVVSPNGIACDFYRSTIAALVKIFSRKHAQVFLSLASFYVLLNRYKQLNVW